jgi:hypothetical protein
LTNKSIQAVHATARISVVLMSLVSLLTAA